MSKLNSKATIIVSGMIAGDPWQGGAAWAVLQYVLGLGRLGHEVFLVEPIPPKAIRPADVSLAQSANAACFSRVTAEFGLQDNSVLVLAGTEETIGLPYEALRRIARRTQLIINISGMLSDEALLARIPVRVYLDIDPAFNQLWQAVQGIDMRFAGHTHFVTIGQEIGESACSVPTCGLSWLKTLQPVVLERWPVARDVVHDALTTIGNWRAYGSIEHNGVVYGQKVHSLRPFFALPTRTRERFLLAMAIHPAETTDLAALHTNGWQLVDPARVADTPVNYQRFIQGSKAEFGIAKSGYVASCCGWFSDRSICYLASGRPVIAQETGFTKYLPVGNGLFSFGTCEDVLGAIEALNMDYAGHCRSARDIAMEFFDSDKVLRVFLERVGM